MRKFVLFGAIAAFSLLVVEAASAGRIGLNGAYTRSQLKDLCDTNGGTYGEGPGGYSCGKQCAGDEWCVVGCKNPSSCYGDCPKCGARIRGALVGTQASEKFWGPSSQADDFSKLARESSPASSSARLSGTVQSVPGAISVSVPPNGYYGPHHWRSSLPILPGLPIIGSLLFGG
jgi:hypothetical protein